MSIFERANTPINQNLIAKCWEYFDLLDMMYSTNPEKYAQQRVQLHQIKQTFRSICRLSGRMLATLIAELVTILSMLVLNLANHDLHQQAGLYVYPAMIGGAMYVAVVHDILDKRKEKLKRQLDNLQNDKTH